jgi:exonuclease III
MKGLFWNSNGLRDHAKPQLLCDLTKEQELDFIAILEIKKSDFTPTVLTHFCANKFFLWSWGASKR